MLPRWAAALIGAVVFYLLYILLVPAIPGPAQSIVGAICLILAIVLGIVGLVLLAMWFVGRSRV